MAASKPRATYHHGQLRAALITHATALLDEEGVDAVTIREVARRASVSHAAPINHFASRAALLTALATEFFRDLAAGIEKARKRAASPREELRSFAQALYTFGMRHPHRYRLLWRDDLLAQEDDLLTTKQAVYDAAIATLAKSRGRKKSPHTVVVALWSMVHGYVTLRLDGTFDARSDEVTGQPRLDAMLDLVLGG